MGVREHTKNIGCDVNAKDRFGFTPLHYAATSGYIDGVEALLQLGADVFAKGGESGQLMPVDIAKARGHLDIADLLGKWGRKAEDPVNMKFKEWLSELDCEGYAQKFIDAGYDLKFINENGLTDTDLDCVGIPTSKMGSRRKLMSKWRIDDFLDGDEGEDIEDDEGSDDDDESGSDDDESGSDDDGSGSDDDESGSDDDESGSDDDESDEE